MLKKTITYDDYEGNTLTEEFYFNFTKLELLEMDVRFEGGLEGYIEKLTKTQSGKNAYYLFKDIVLSAYGRKTEDGKRFEKSPQLREEFESSPAMAELILGFLQNPAEGAAFIESCLPARLVAEAKALAAKESNQPELPLPSAPMPTQVIVDNEVGLTPRPYPVLIEDNTTYTGLTPKQLTEMSREELMELYKQKTGE